MTDLLIQGAAHLWTGLRGDAMRATGGCDIRIRQGVITRIRPVLMTALMAAIGLMPAATSTGIGSETSRPLAIVVIGGLITSTILTLFIFPILFKRVYRFKTKKLA